MNRRLSGLLVAAVATLTAIPAEGATVCLTADSLTVVQATEAGKLEVSFRKCMANDLFTFHTVLLDGRLINSARHSDNIGPFLLEGYGWTGGNHLSDSGRPSARTIGVDIRADGCEMACGSREAEAIEVAVTNELLMPDGSLFALETVRYLVAGNSIEVEATHSYCMDRPVTVDRYYGMQSMCRDEDAILVPGRGWVATGPGGTSEPIKVTLSEAPRAEAFAERTPCGYQACYMLPEDLGTRSALDPADFVFIGNSYGKCYHKLMGSTELRPGDTSRWHGVYSWFVRPERDGFSDGAPEPVFAYPAYIGGKPATISIDGSGHASVIPTE